MTQSRAEAFDIIRLPRMSPDTHDADDIALAESFRTLRLLALRTDPDAFASSYDIEIKRGLDQTLTRLSNPKAANLIAALHQDSTSHIPSLQWAGMIALLGPEDDFANGVSAKSDPMGQMTPGSEPASSTEQPREELTFALNNVFVKPEARGRGLARRLMDAALQLAQDECLARHASRWKCTVLVDAENEPARALYENAGFMIVGEEHYVQQPRQAAPREGTGRSPGPVT